MATQVEFDVEPTWGERAEKARRTLADEWNQQNPQTPAEILEFYRNTPNLGEDLEVFHDDPTRQTWTRALLHVARQGEAKTAIDIGCGAGHDIKALAETGVEVVGVEPNDLLRDQLVHDGYNVLSDITEAPIELADVLSCFDVLEHVPDPEAFLGYIASRAQIGAVLLETCATFDCGTPLHLPQNRGWRTGRCMERHGWDKIAEEGRIRVWQRKALENRVSTAIIPVSFRSITMPTHRSVVALLTVNPLNPLGWREFTASEAGLLRARNIAASRWYTDTADDVFLMIDEDITFTPDEADRLVTRCREGCDIIAAAYPVRDGSNLAIRTFGAASVMFGQGEKPFQVRQAGTGFMAVHRKVLDKLIPTLPLIHGNQPWSYWPIFSFRVVPDEAAGGFNELTEDYNLCELARDLGFGVWVDPSIKLDHYGVVPISISNMTRIKEAIDAH